MTDPYENALRSMREASIDYLAIGSWALKRADPENWHDYTPPDCDLLLPNSFVVLRKAIHLLNTLGWRTAIWETIVDGKEPDCQYEGKFYLRAQKATCQLDLTYEYPWLDWTTAWKNRLELDGINYAAIEDINYLRQLKQADNQSL